IDVWYEGIMVPGSPYLLKWELARNMVRPKSASQYALPNYIAVAPRMYKGIVESLTRRMIPFADLIQMTHLKLQQVLQRVVPDGVFIDADGINEVDLGTGGSYNPEDALRLYFQTGSVIGRSMTTDGDINHGRIPIQELNTNSGQGKITALINAYNQYLSMIRDVTGLNEARDASTPSPDALVGVQKLAALNSNTATRHILEGSLFITRRLSEALSLRVADILEYSDFKEEFIMQIGKYAVGMLEEIKDLYLHDFGIFIEVAPDEEEKAQLESNIQMALQRDQISLEDAIDIRQMKNLKLANELLKMKRKDKGKKDMENEQAKIQMQTQGNIQSSQAAAQSALQKVQAEAQAKSMIIQAQEQSDIRRMQAEAQIKEQLMQREFEYNMQLKGMEVEKVKQLDMDKEKAKDERTKIQATQQSKLIEQRQKDLPAMNFESEEDSLDGFDLEQFNPR
ncbi:MAG: Cellulophaga phage phi38:1, partial [Bacteroidota bacterium]